LVAFRRSHRRIITLGGNSWGRSILFYAAPFLLLAAFRAHTLYGYALPALVAAFPMFVSILGEELGWRGFLQDALRPLSPVKRFLDWRVVGVLALHDQDYARMVSAKDRGNLVDFLFSRDSS
jgi:membrane protease YdiL (CAAX protease family)